MFEKGQSYVALSRAATMEGLQVLRFDPKKVRRAVMAHVSMFTIADTLMFIIRVRFRSVRIRRSSNGTSRWRASRRDAYDT